MSDRNSLFLLGSKNFSILTIFFIKSSPLDKHVPISHLVRISNRRESGQEWLLIILGVHSCSSTPIAPSQNILKSLEISTVHYDTLYSWTTLKSTLIDFQINLTKKTMFEKFDTQLNVNFSKFQFSRFSTKITMFRQFSIICITYW